MGYKELLLSKLPNLDLTTDAEYVDDLMNANALVNVQQCSLLHGYAIPAIFLHNIILPHAVNCGRFCFWRRQAAIFCLCMKYLGNR